MRKKVAAVLILLSLLLTLSPFAATNIASAKTLSKAQPLFCQSSSVIVFDENYGGQSYSCSGYYSTWVVDAYEVYNTGWSGYVYGEMSNNIYRTTRFCDNTYISLPDYYGILNIYLSPTRMPGC